MVDRTKVEPVGDGAPTRVEARTPSSATRVDEAPSGPGATRIEPSPRVVEAGRDGEGAAWIPIALPPTLARRFTLVRKIGQGGEASVWLATRSDGGGQVAIKAFSRPPRYDVDLHTPAYRERFRREHTVEVYERGEERGFHYEVMEYCAPGTLADLNAARSGPFPERFLIDVVREIAAALESMHPVVHGDLKPSNVLVRTRDPLDLVLTDFGLTVDLGDRSSRTNVGRGTAAYLAPGGEARTRPAGDWWALGITVLELVLGRNVFQHSDGSWMSEATIRESLAARPVPLDGVPVGRVRDLIRGLLVRDPDRRWGGAQVRDWLAGGSPPVADADGGNAVREAAAPRPVRAFPFAGHLFTDPAALGAAMRAEPERARRLAGGVELRELADWVALAAPDAGLSGLVPKADRFRPDLTATLAAQLLDPTGPATFRGRDVSSATALVDLARDGGARGIVTDLYERRVLPTLALECGASHLGLVHERWADLIERTRAVIAVMTKYSPEEPEVRALALVPAAVGAGTAASVINGMADGAATPLARETPWFARLCARSDVDATVHGLAIVLTAKHAEKQARDQRAVAAQREAERKAREEAERRQQAAVRARAEHEIASRHQQITASAFRRVPVNVLKLVPVWGALVYVGVVLGQTMTPDDEFADPTRAAVVALGIWLLAHLIGGRAQRLRFAWLGLLIGLALVLVPLMTGNSVIYLTGAPVEDPPWFALVGSPAEAEALNSPVWSTVLKVPAVIALGYLVDCVLRGERRQQWRRSRQLAVTGAR